jgi:hypothetical protein
VTDRVLAVSWLAIPLGVTVSAAVVAVALWRSPGADAAYRQAVLLHGAGLGARRGRRAAGCVGGVLALPAGGSARSPLSFLLPSTHLQ